MTPAELNEKKLQFFRTVLTAIAECADVLDSDTIETMARRALKEEFCESCGAHPTNNTICSVCGRPHCDTCYPNIMEACPICGEAGNIFLEKLYDADERIANEDSHKGQ